MNLREALRRAEERLARADIADAKHDAWLLLRHVTDITRAAYFLAPNAELPPEKEEMFFSMVEERTTHRPLQYITGTQDFMGLTFHVNEHVLIPRQDTEILVEKAIGILEKEFSCRRKEDSEISENRFSDKRTTKIPGEEFSQEEKKMWKSLSGETPEDKKNYQILDLCTGSGCIAVSLAAWALQNSWPAEVTATDISEKALQVAKTNAETILTEELRRKKEEDGVKGRRKMCKAGGLEYGAGPGVTEKAAYERKAAIPDHRIRFLRGDLFAAVGREKFSMILSNPPYIRTAEIETLMPEVRDFEPRLALDGAEDGLALYRRIAAEAPEHLAQGGVLLLEIGCDEAEAVSGLLAAQGFCDVCVWKDYAGLDRVVYGRYEPT